jgi:hypothetical protein
MIISASAVRARPGNVIGPGGPGLNYDGRDLPCQFRSFSNLFIFERTFSNLFDRSFVQIWTRTVSALPHAHTGILAYDKPAQLRARHGSVPHRLPYEDQSG